MTNGYYLLIVCLENLEEARKKSKKAVYLSDLSTNEDTQNDRHIQGCSNNKNKIDSPPSLRHDILLPTISRPVIDISTKADSSSETESILYDSDKDPSYELPLVLKGMIISIFNYLLILTMFLFMYHFLTSLVSYIIIVYGIATTD